MFITDQTYYKATELQGWILDEVLALPPEFDDAMMWDLLHLMMGQ